MEQELQVAGERRNGVGRMGREVPCRVRHCSGSMDGEWEAEG